MLEDLTAEAQQALDELFKEGRLPFKLVAYRVSSLGMEEYIIYFHDSRLRSIDISWRQGESFKAVVRYAIQERMKRRSGPDFRKKSDDRTAN